MFFGKLKGCLFGVITGFLLATALLAAGIYSLVGGNVENFLSAARVFGAYYIINNNYVEDIDAKKLMRGTIDGMIGALGDRYSRYLDEKSFEELKRHTEASFGGIGIVMGYNVNESKVTVLSVMEGTPGEAAGLKSGDEIFAVDGVPVSEYEFEQVAMKVRGQIGTNVTLTIVRGEEKFDVTIERANIRVKTAVGKMLEDKIGYIRIVSFAEKTHREFAEALDNLEKEGAQAIVIDLRENPGGLLTTCNRIAEQIVPKGTIVSVVDKNGKKEEHKSKLEATKYKLVVLINENSASASEILAGALQDTKAATLVGTKSYGKGSVQAVFPFGKSDAVKLTIAKYYTPSGRSINGTGIEPDVTVELPQGAETDLQLEKAKEILREQIEPKEKGGDDK